MYSISKQSKNFLSEQSGQSLLLDCFIRINIKSVCLMNILERNILKLRKISDSGLTDISLKVSDRVHGKTLDISAY